jgi:hypothetical protein
VQIANSEHYSEYRNSETAEKIKKEDKEKEVRNLLEQYSFYLKTHNQFISVLIQFLTVENTVYDC